MIDPKPDFQHPQPQSKQPAYGEVFSSELNLQDVNTNIQELHRKVEEVKNMPINLNTDITGMIETLSAAPVGAPFNVYQQFKIVNLSGTWYLYFYDTVSHAWERASDGGGGGGSPGGSNTQVQFNDSGSFGGDADLTYDKTSNTLNLNGTFAIPDGSGGFLYAFNNGAPGDFAISTPVSGSSLSVGADQYVLIDAVNGDTVIQDLVLATNATHGFIRIPATTGTPTGTPASGFSAVPLVFDKNNNKLWIHNGTTWKSVTLT